MKQIKTIFSVALIAGFMNNAAAQAPPISETPAKVGNVVAQAPSISETPVEVGNVVLEDSNYVIYSVKDKKVVSPQDIIDEMKKYDVLFYGESHNDSIAHKMQTLLFQLMFDTYGDKATVSMEMFDREVQYIMDEYLSGKIKKKYFLKDSRKWSNYKDYEPMVEYAKRKRLDVIAANAPFRYVSYANKGGMEGLQGLTDRAKTAMAPLPYNVASGAYKEKLEKMMGGAYSNMITGQSLWDATMAYSVYEYNQNNPGSKILHLNGKFHTEEYFGIIQRLADYSEKVKPLVITGVAHDESFPNVKFEDYTHLGDYIIFTNSRLPRSYEQ